jgi:DNA-binding response OmpR family regulator
VLCPTLYWVNSHTLALGWVQAYLEDGRLKGFSPETMTTPRLRVLYCEDDLDSREIIRLILTTEGFDAVCPENPVDFLKLAKEEHFDAYLLDYVMPEMSGGELCRRIREFDSRTPIIFYSGAAYPSDKEEALAAGAQAYIAKPATMEEVVCTIRSTIQASKAALSSLGLPSPTDLDRH